MARELASGSHCSNCNCLTSGLLQAAAARRILFSGSSRFPGIIPSKTGAPSKSCANVTRRAWAPLNPLFIAAVFTHPKFGRRGRVFVFFSEDATCAITWHWLLGS